MQKLACQAGSIANSPDNASNGPSKRHAVLLARYVFRTRLTDPEAWLMLDTDLANFLLFDILNNRNVATSNKEKEDQ